MKKIEQFRFYQDNDNRNHPKDLTINTLTSGNIFSGYASITQLGIQGRPGTKIFLTDDFKYPIIIGQTGIFEISLPQNAVGITTIHFDETHLNEYADSPLLIDIIYEGQV